MGQSHTSPAASYAAIQRPGHRYWGIVAVQTLGLSVKS